MRLLIAAVLLLMIAGCERDVHEAFSKPVPDAYGERQATIHADES